MAQEDSLVYISQTYSPQMAGKNDVAIAAISLEEARRRLYGWTAGPYIDRESERDGSDAAIAVAAKSCIGHADVAAVLSSLLGETIPANRITVSLNPGDTVIVGQYVGPRLPEGATALPEGARIEWYRVDVA
jgi:hypothetical protein